MIDGPRSQQNVSKGLPVTNPDAVDTTSEPTGRRSTRRALLGLGAVGAALAGSRSVSAAPGDSDASDAIVSFVIGAELAARDLYLAAPADMGADGLPAVLARHHEAYAERISGIAGMSARGRDDALYDSLESAFESGDLAQALELENTLVATHAAVLGETDDLTMLRAVASIVSAESRHAAVLASEDDAELDAILTNPATPLAPEA